MICLTATQEELLQSSEPHQLGLELETPRKLLNHSSLQLETARELLDCLRKKFAPPGKLLDRTATEQQASALELQAESCNL